MVHVVVGSLTKFENGGRYVSLFEFQSTYFAVLTSIYLFENINLFIIYYLSLG